MEDPVKFFIEDNEGKVIAEISISEENYDVNKWVILMGCGIFQRRLMKDWKNPEDIRKQREIERAILKKLDSGEQV